MHANISTQRTFSQASSSPSPYLPQQLMAVPGPSNVTISLLPVSLSLVHVPRSRLPQLSHPVLRQILQPNPTFLNVTCNEIELSLFAEHHILADFELIARRDRHRLRSRSGSGSAHRRPAFDDNDRVEFSCEKWKVLQLDSHSDQLGTSQSLGALQDLNKTI
ncbi:hypothetical protein J3R83DRAFT_779 [Lanmaoa asiatica]|nr:hypothetical protein J3R83DRAFT_779 [Lanmaoa asiatica]